MGLSGSNLARRALLLASIAVATIVAIVSGRILTAYQDTFKIAARSEMRAVQLLETNADGTFRSIEIILNHAVDEVSAYEDHDTRGGSLADRFIKIARPWDFVHGIAYAGKDGILRQLIHREGEEEVALDTNIDHSHDAMFTAHRDGIVPPGKIFISAPYRGKIADHWVIAVTKAVTGPDGQFRGAVFVTINLDTFARLFIGVVDEPVLGLALVKLDGDVLFTMPDNDQVGRS